MKLIPVLARVHYDKINNIIIGIEELDSEYTEYLCNKNDYCISGEVCEIKTYMKEADLVFRVHNPTARELQNYRLPTGYVIYLQGNNYYICFRNIYINGRLNNKIYNPAYTVGTFRIDNGEGKEITVNVHSVSDEDYTAIVEDLININNRLIEEKSYNSNMTIGDLWESSARELRKQFLLLKSAVREIEKNPDENLEKKFVYVRSQDVKKFTPHTMTDLSAGKSKVRTVINQTTLDTDEHCIIKSYLENMKKLTLRYQSMMEADYKYQITEIKQELIAGDRNEREFFEECIKNNTLKISRMRGELQKLKADMNELYSEIDSFIRKSEILKNSSGNKKLRSTNLFSMHPAYRRAYAIMKNNSEKIHIVEFNENENIKIKDKSANLYEKWCLIKMLSILTMVYGFRFSDKNDSLKDIINQCIQENDTIRDSSFTLECDNPEVKVTIDYDKPVDPNNKEYSYRPDFMFTIESGSEKLKFCMDAKYKNYDIMNYTLDDDMEKVAHYHYISEMKRKYNINISGSYLLHCTDISRKIRFIHNGDISYGAICMTPSDESKNKSFCFLIQMIMEHYFKFYRKKCWICGNEILEIQNDETFGQKPKYRIYCNICGHFLIETHCHNQYRIQHKYKLGKHICNNYYPLENGKPWNVNCVECGSSL